MNKGMKFAILSSVFIGIAVVLQNVAVKKSDPITFSIYALLISSIFLFGIMLVSKKNFNVLNRIKNSADFWKITLSRNVFGILLLMYGFQNTPAISSVIMLRLEPIFVILFGYFLLKERIRKKEVLYVFLLIFGAILMSAGGNFQIGQSQIGYLFIVAALVFLAYSYIPSRRITQKIEPLTLTAFSNLAGGIIMLAIGIIFSKSLVMNAETFSIALTAIILFYVIGLTLWFESLKLTKAWTVAALLSLSPISGSLTAFLWLGESLNTVQLIGAVIIVAISYKLSIGRK